MSNPLLRRGMRLKGSAAFVSTSLGSFFRLLLEVLLHTEALAALLPGDAS